MKLEQMPGHEVIKLFSCSTQLSMKFQMLIKAKNAIEKKNLYASKLADVVFTMLIIVGILIIISMINSMLSLEAAEDIMHIELSFLLHCLP